MKRGLERHNHFMMILFFLCCFHFHQNIRSEELKITWHLRQKREVKTDKRGEKKTKTTLGCMCTQS